MAGTLNLLVGASLAAAQLSGGNPSLGGGGGGTQGAAAPTLVTWTEEEFQPGVFGPDDAVDIVHWIDDQGTSQTGDDIPYVFMTGFQTTANGGTVFATYKYRARIDPSGDQFEARAFYPSPGSVAPKERFKAVSLTLDNRTGEIYVTGQGGDPNSPTGLDYLTIKYDVALGQQWVSSYNGPGNGDDVPVDIDFVAGQEPGQGVVLVTGTSPGLAGDDDIATVAYNVGTGNLTELWEDLPGVDGQGIRRYAGTGDGRDTAVGVVGWSEIASMQGDGAVEGILELRGYVAGTTFDSHSGTDYNNDIIALAYATDFYPLVPVTGARVGVRLFEFTVGGEDIATGLATFRNGQGISAESMADYVTICGYTNRIGESPSINDTDYVVLNYFVDVNSVGTNWLTNGWTGVHPARYFDGTPMRILLSDDRALAIGRSSPIEGLPIDGRVWITGRVHEEDGIDYDVGTVVYDTYDWDAVEIDSWIETLDARSGGSDDRAVAIDVHGDIAYVGGWTGFSPVMMFFASKYELFSASSTWNTVFRNTFGPDAGERIISVIDGMATPVFMTGSSTNAANGDNQFTVRIDQ